MSDLGLFDLVFGAFGSSTGYQWLALGGFAIVILILLFAFLQYSVIQAGMLIAFFVFAAVLTSTVVFAQWFLSALVIIIGLALGYTFYKMFSR